jgi:hypothetical protein
MAKITHGRTKAKWVAAIANKVAPTVAELTAGVDLTPGLPADGIQQNSTKNNASISMLDDSFVSEAVGTWGTGVTLKMVRHEEDADDDYWNLFEYGADGFLVISRHGGFLATDKVEVYPAEAHEPQMLATAENEYQQFETQLAITDTPAAKATVAA